jgi:anti-sigma28 factor (negative regulator of flagellin synthesis)
MKMSDLVVQEYADLVKLLEGRPNVHAHPRDHTRSNSPSSGSGLPNGLIGTSASTTTLVDSPTEGKSGLQKLVSKFNSETTHLQSDIDCLTHELAVSIAKRNAERESADRDRVELAKTKFELGKLRMDDQTVAKMVSQYM